MSGFSRAFRTNGATALTSCTSSSSTDDTSASSQPPGVALAQIDLLQILVEPPLGEEVACAGDVLGRSATCDSSADCATPTSGSRHDADGQHRRERRSPSYLAEEPATGAGIARRAALSPSSMCR